MEHRREIIEEKRWNMWKRKKRKAQILLKLRLNNTQFLVDDFVVLNHVLAKR